MKGTLTYHLPLKRGPETPPEATLVVRRVMPGRWHAGLSVCSKSDQFVRRIGRARAAAKLRGNPFMADTPLELFHLIEKHLDQLNKNRPHTLGAATVMDLHALIQPLSKMRVE